MRALLVLPVLCILVGCPGDPRRVEQAPRSSPFADYKQYPFDKDFAVRKDDFKKTVSIRGPDAEENGNEASKVFVRTTAAPDGTNRQLYFAMEDYDWVFYDEALLADGSKLAVRSIDQRVDEHQGQAVCDEDLVVDLDDALWAKLQKEGAKIRLYGKRGHHDFTIGQAYFERHAKKEAEVLPVAPSP